VPNDFERLLRDVPGAFPRPDDVATASARRSALSRATRRRLPRLSLVAAAAVAASPTTLTCGTEPNSVRSPMRTTA
jgi:hypothetical protein